MNNLTQLRAALEHCKEMRESLSLNLSLNTFCEDLVGEFQRNRDSLSVVIDFLEQFLEKESAKC